MAALQPVIVSGSLEVFGIGSGGIIKSPDKTHYRKNHEEN